MKKKRTADRDEMPSEYELDHSKAKPNRFVSRMPQGKVVGVVLAEDVAKVFNSSEAVNRFLRSAIEAMPEHKRPSKKNRSKKSTKRRAG